VEKANYSRDANAALLTQYAGAMSTMLKQFHEYKARHVVDVAQWHRSYRAQLAEARSENSLLREQIWDMQAHAGKANETLREFRSRYDDYSKEEDDDKGTGVKNEAGRRRWENRVRARAARQELRFWKRMAMPELPDDDPYWSDDDDLIDPIEKERLRELEMKAAELELKAAEQLKFAAAAFTASDADSVSSGEDGEVPLSALQGQARQGMMGGVAMEREGTGGMMPVPPPRPPSASSTGSSGQ
jgi:hypothetical protein